MKKRVLITGAGGAIGVHMIAHFLEKTDWEIIGIDSFKSDHKGYFDRLTTLLSGSEAFHTSAHARVMIVTHDLNAPFTERELDRIGKVDYIVNLASRSDVQNSIDDPLPFVRNNTELMLNMLEAAKSLLKFKYETHEDPVEGSFQRPCGYEGTFLHFSTDEVYGPASIDSSGHPEWDPILPSNPYSASKACQEALAIAWWRSYDIPLIITNTMNNFGEMQAPSKFPAMIQQKIERSETIQVHATKDGAIGTRFYLHSRNAADAVLFILENVKPKPHGHGEIDRPVRLNIVGDKRVSNLELVGTIGRLMKRLPKYELVSFHEHNPGHDLHYGLDGKALADLGWKAPMTFEESLEQTIAWQKAHPEWMK